MLLTQFWKSPRTVGALVPSSLALSREMVGTIDRDAPEKIVEFGPGTGPITALLYAAMPAKTDYLGIELNAEFYHHLRRRFPQFTFVNDAAANLGAILRAAGWPRVDRIICGMPWASLPRNVQDDTLDAVLTHLRPGGAFVTFAYVQGFALPGAWRFRKRLTSAFAPVRTSRIVWSNVPPAFVYVCTKPR